MSQGALAPYCTPHEREQRFAELCDRLGCRPRQFGESVEGRPLFVVQIPAHRRAAPKVLVTANIHGIEAVSAFAALELMRRLAEPDDTVDALRAEAEVWLIPCLNPDGYARTFELEGRGPIARMRTNARGVDLNRNFPLPRGATRSKLPFTGSHRAGDATYHGPAPLSEPESAALASLLEEVSFHAAVNLHSTMGTLIPARCTNRMDYRTYVRLCRVFQDHQAIHRYRRLSSLYLDGFTGELEDFLHHRFGTWAFCVELFPIVASLQQQLFATVPFWRFNPRNPEYWVHHDLPALCQLLLRAAESARPLQPKG